MGHTIGKVAPLRAVIARYRSIESAGKSLPLRARESLRSLLRRG